MCYHWIITGRSLAWFLLSLVTAMLISCSLMLPTWLLGQSQIAQMSANYTMFRRPSVGIYSRCIVSQSTGNFHCGSFDLDGLATDSTIYPTEWKTAMVFLTTALLMGVLTVSFSLLSCCRQTLIYNKSIHSVTGSAQVVVGILVLVAVFLHPLGWSASRVKRLCGPDADAFFPADCIPGPAMYSAIAAVVLSFTCAILSLGAETSKLRNHVRRRVEQGEKLICIP